MTAGDSREKERLSDRTSSFMPIGIGGIFMRPAMG